jgi:hypothetical protein
MTLSSDRGSFSGFERPTGNIIRYNCNALRRSEGLDRAFVETDHRSVGIGRLGIEVEHVFHAGDIFAVDPGNAPHILAPGLEIVFGQPPAHRLARQAVVPGELDYGAIRTSVFPAGP